jgi:hypothetical protein
MQGGKLDGSSLLQNSVKYGGEVRKPNEGLETKLEFGHRARLVYCN